MHIKQKIRHHFNRAAATYDAHCAVQNTICQHAIQLLKRYHHNFEHIADFACGTGESTLQLSNAVNFTHCYAVDFSEDLLAVAQAKLAHLQNMSVICSDFEQKINLNKPLSVILCNMGLQWSDSIQASIRLWQQYLSDDGWLLFSIPIDGNFPELQSTYTLTSPSHQTVMNTLATENYRLIASDMHDITDVFNDPISLLKALKATGANYNKTISPSSRGLSPLALRKIFTTPNNKILTYKILTYKIGIYLARKQS